ncbi:hypothetical protein H8959_016207 [Pygathrix nigripes]
MIIFNIMEVTGSQSVFNGLIIGRKPYQELRCSPIPVLPTMQFRVRQGIAVKLYTLKESLKQAQLERDEYAQHLKGERAWWQQRMRKMSQEVRSDPSAPPS